MLYNTAEQILKEIHFDEYDSIVYGVLALQHWINRYCTYDLDYLGTSYAKDVIIDHTGVCENYANATVYLCTLRRIPCVYVEFIPENAEGIPIYGDGHAWNAIKYDGKWYNLDLLNGFLFTRKDYAMYPNSETKFGINIKISEKNLFSESDENALSTILGRWGGIKNNGYVLDIEYSQNFFNKILGLNGVEKIDVFDYALTANKIYRDKPFRVEH